MQYCEAFPVYFLVSVDLYLFEKGFGGKGTNQCVMAAKLEARTAAKVAKVNHSTGRQQCQ